MGHYQEALLICAKCVMLRFGCLSLGQIFVCVCVRAWVRVCVCLWEVKAEIN